MIFVVFLLLCLACGREMGFLGCYGPALSVGGSNHQEASKVSSWVSSSVSIIVLVLQHYNVRLLGTGQQGLGAVGCGLGSIPTSWTLAVPIWASCLLACLGISNWVKAGPSLLWGMSF